MRAQCVAALVWSGDLRNIKHHGFVVTMVRTGTFMDEDTFKFINIFLAGGVPVPEESVHIQDNRKRNIMFSLPPFQGRDIEDKTKQ
jgi:hypothetical protein